MNSNIFNATVKYVKLKLNLPNLLFLPCSGDNIHTVVALVAEENVIVFSSGSSQYIYPEHLEVPV